MGALDSATALAELAPGGRLRAAINYGNAVLVQREETTGVPQGITVDLVRELARRLAVPFDLVLYGGAAKVVDAAAFGEWDVAFLAIDPVRATQILFTSPYVIIEGTYLVHQDSPFRRVGDVDRDGVRIAVGRGAAYDLFLTRSIEHATLVRAPSTPELVPLFAAGGLDAVAGVRQPLEAATIARPEWRVLPDSFMAIEQAMCTPAGRHDGCAYLQAFLAEMKTGGFVADALTRHGQHDVLVAF